MRGFNPFICQICGDSSSGPWGVYHGLMCCEECGRKRDEEFYLKEQAVHETGNFGSSEKEFHQSAEQ